MTRWISYITDDTPRADVRFLRLVRSYMRAPAHGGVPDDDTALFTTDELAADYVKQHLLPSRESAATAPIMMSYVPVDVSEIPDIDIDGIDDFRFEYLTDGETPRYDPGEPHPPVLFPFQPRFRRGDFVRIANPSTVLAPWQCRPEDEFVYGVVWEAPTTKAEFLAEHGHLMDPADVPPDPNDLYVSKEVLDIAEEVEDPSCTSHVNEYTVYHLELGHCVDHTHYLAESALVPLHHPLPQEHLILEFVQRMFLDESSAPDGIGIIYEPPARMRNTVYFDFATRSFRMPATELGSGQSHE